MKRISSWPRTGSGSPTQDSALGGPSAQASVRLWGLIVLLAFTPGIANAWYGYCGSYYEGVRYSPYALSYYHSGLIPGYVHYSPYALNYYGSSFIYDGTQYTPYALSYYNSGLVQDYGIYPGYGSTFVFPARGVHHGFRAPAIHRAPPVARRRAQGGPQSRRIAIGNPAPPCPASKQDGTGSQTRKNAFGDPMDVIRRHLHARGLASACIDRILRVDNQLVSVDFLVKDRNLLIKYWNPQELERLSTKEGYQQKACAKYKEDWERYAQQYQQTGGEIYTITASEPESIVAALDSCTKLNPGLGTPTQQTIYAKN